MANSFKLLVLTLLCSCAANVVHNEAINVEIVYAKPDMNKCVFLKEVSGSQGNWVTGDFTSNEDLLVGARNTLKNNTYSLGGNVVHVHEVTNASAWKAAGNTATAITGSAYSCEKTPLTALQKKALYKANLRKELISLSKNCNIGNGESCWGAAWRSSALNKKENAYAFLEKAFKAGWKNWEHLESDKDIEVIRNTDRFKALVSKYRK
ncbi:DUF4156 domain-containing protein [Halobacteriovorax sp. JY17]|uniref:DUF4156 domain-containing protein n=1 Tax=Halobacteriovorax sp. JY17 TaxID=2014617 RepID=UPI000C4C39C3|nr:DUF4156 domain-containing protein [Halobacteriovorax sp. JY17]PIK15642.1 MAG: hypothetical protein CES88_02640 [Halobacteriovorax sp. JY17]